MPFTSPFGSAQIIDKPFHELILSDALLHNKTAPNKHILIDSESGRKYTVPDVYNLSNSIATWLHRKGLRKGNSVLICLPNCIEYAIVTLGCSIRGGVITTVNSLYTEQEIVRQMEDSECVFVFTMGTFLDKVIAAADRLGGQVFRIVAIKTEYSRSLPANVVDFREVIGLKPDYRLPKVNFNTKQDLVLLPYSSGTTGKPKGVIITHYNMAAAYAAFKKYFYNIVVPNKEHFSLEAEINIAILPLFHIYGFTIFMFYLGFGITSVTIPRFLPEKYLGLIQLYRPRSLYVAPPLVVFLAKHPMVANYDISSVQYIYSGAAPVGKDLSEDVMKRHPNLKYVLQGYGMTEMSFFSHLPDQYNSPHGSSGRIISNMLCKIVDLKTGKELGTGQRGEKLWTKTAGCILVKFNQFWHEINMPLISGDIGYYDENQCIYVVDRLKELIKVKGFQVAPAELDDLLLTHPSIQDAAVIGVPDSQSGELPKAFVVLKPGQHVTAKEILHFIEDKVAHYKRLMGGVEFIEEIPKSPSGKILRRVLRDKAIKNAKL